MIPAESARDTIAALGEVGLLQFKDMNADKSAFQRTYANQVRHPRRLPHREGATGPPRRRGRDLSASPAPPQVKRCDEMARKLRFFKDQVRRGAHAARSAEDA